MILAVDVRGTLTTDPALGQTGSASGRAPEHRHVMPHLLRAQNCAEATKEAQELPRM